mgnify:CR=1 FL=1
MLTDEPIERRGVLPICRLERGELPLRVRQRVAHGRLVRAVRLDASRRLRVVGDGRAQSCVTAARCAGAVGGARRLSVTTRLPPAQHAHRMEAVLARRSEAVERINQLVATRALTRALGNASERLERRLHYVDAAALAQRAARRACRGDNLALLSLHRAARRGKANERMLLRV